MTLWVYAFLHVENKSNWNTGMIEKNFYNGKFNDCYKYQNIPVNLAIILKNPISRDVSWPEGGKNLKSLKKCMNLG